MEVKRQQSYADGVKYTQILAAVAACLGGFALGTALGWSSPVLPLMEADGSSLPTTANEGSWVASLVTLGAFFGAVVAGALSDRFGRKTVIVFSAVPFVAGWLLIAFAVNLTMVYIGRIVTGLIGGVLSVAAPVYIAETSSATIRGMLSAMYMLNLCLGILFTYCFGIIMTWENLSILCAVIPVAMAICIAPMPESPLYLVDTKQIDRARKSLTFFRAPGYDIDQDLFDIEEELRERKANRGLLVEFSHMSILKPFMVSIVLFTIQEFSGVNTVLFYTTEIFSATNSSLGSDIETIIIGVLQAIFAMVGTSLVDRFGRRTLLLISSLGMSVSITALGAYFYVENNGGDVSFLGWLPMVSLFIYISIYSIGIGPVPWVIMAELFPPQVKGFAVAIVASFNWIAAFIVTVTFQSLLDDMGQGPTFWLYAGILLAGFFFILFFVPETKGKSLLEIQQYYGGDLPDELCNGPAATNESPMSEKEREATATTSA